MCFLRSAFAGSTCVHVRMTFGRLRLSPDYPTTPALYPVSVRRIRVYGIGFLQIPPFGWTPLPSLAVPVITARRGLTPPGNTTCLAHEKRPATRITSPANSAGLARTWVGVGEPPGEGGSGGNQEIRFSCKNPVMPRRSFQSLERVLMARSTMKHLANAPATIQVTQHRFCQHMNRFGILGPFELLPPTR